MTWFAYYNTATGKLHTYSEQDIVPPDGLSKVSVGVVRPTGIWNPVTHVFDPLPPIRDLSKKDFLDRFTKAELGGLLGSDFQTTDTKVVAFLRYLDLVERVDLDDQIMTIGMTKVVQAGLLTGARATEIMQDG